MELSRSAARRLAEETKPKKDLQMGEEAAFRLTRAAEVFIRAASRESWKIISWSSSEIHANGNGRKRLQEEHVVEGLRKLLADPELLARLWRELGLE